MDFHQLSSYQMDNPFEIELEQQDGTQTVLENISEFFDIEETNIPSTSNTLILETTPATPPQSWVLCTGPNVEDFTFVCLWKNCFQHLASAATLEKHLNDHFNFDFLTPESSGDLNCPIYGCEIDLESTQHVYRHLRSHIFQAEKQKVGLEFYRKLFPDLTPCGFERTSYLPLEGDPWVCGWKDCKKIFDDLRQFIDHVASHLDDCAEPGDSGMYPCHWISGHERKQCDQRFAHKSFLRIHLRCHSGDRVCACPYCGTFLANTTKLTDHVHRRQLGTEASLTCALCQKSFNTNRLLKIHCRKHVKSVKCAYCEVVMDCASAVAKHMKIVHAKVKNEKCPECGIKFGLKTDLQKHIDAIHKSEPQFACRYCPKRFRWVKQQITHEKTHCEDYVATPYLCHKCPLRYKNGSSLSRHFVNVHSLPLPNGFNRFQYKRCHDGFYRLQTSRCISKNVVEAPKLDL